MVRGPAAMTASAIPTECASSSHDSVSHTHQRRQQLESNWAGPGMREHPSQEYQWRCQLESNWAGMREHPSQEYQWRCIHVVNFMMAPKGQAFYLYARLLGVVMLDMHIAIKRPRTRSAVARQVSNTHVRDLSQIRTFSLDPF